MQVRSRAQAACRDGAVSGQGGSSVRLNQWAHIFARVLEAGWQNSFRRNSLGLLLRRVPAAWPWAWRACQGLSTTELAPSWLS